MNPRPSAAKVLSRAELVDRFGPPGRDGTVVFTNGCFDLLHYGHVRYLERARALGDALVVGVNTDASVRRLRKGPGRPFVDQDGRVGVLASLESVDAVCLFDEDTPAELIAELVPDVLVKGGDYEADEVVGRDVVEAAGGRVELVPWVEGRSTSELVGIIKERSGP